VIKNFSIKEVVPSVYQLSLSRGKDYVYIMFNRFEVVKHENGFTFVHLYMYEHLIGIVPILKRDFEKELKAKGFNLYSAGGCSE